MLVLKNATIILTKWAKALIFYVVKLLTTLNFKHKT